MQLDPTQNGKQGGGAQKQTRRRRGAKAVRITLTISEGLLELVDEAAEKEYASRSDVIRTALLWYLRPQGRDLAQTDPEVIFQVLKQRRARAAIRKLAKDVPRNAED
jgi:metal-responsive CopG/Arc/MetJ family transcriptional regulator